MGPPACLHLLVSSWRSELAIKPYNVSMYVACSDDDQLETKRWRHAGGSEYPSIHKNLPCTDSKAGAVVSQLATEPRVCICLIGCMCDKYLWETHGPEVSHTR